MSKYKYNPTTTKLPGAPTPQSTALSAEFDAYLNNPAAAEPKKKGLFGSIGEATGISGFGEAIGTAIAAPKEVKQLEQSQQALIESQTRLLERIKQRKAEGADTTKLMSALQDITNTIQKQGNSATSQLTNDLTDEDIYGDALKLVGTAAGFATIPGAAVAAKGATGILQGAKFSALEGAASGALSGIVGGAGTSIKDQQDFSAGVSGALSGGVTGAIGGGIGGALIGGVTGGLKGRALRKSVFDAQVSSGQKPPIDLNSGTVTTINQTTGEQVTRPINSVQKKAIQAAKSQGYEDADTAFVLSMDTHNKGIGAEMLEISEKAITDKRSRALNRPEDILGRGLVKKVSNIDGVNSEAGKRVDEVARSLQGQQVDGTSVVESTMAALQREGVTVGVDGTLDFSNSIFKKTPELANKIKKALSDVPTGNMDAYQLHLFKKSLDQIVEYGKTSGKAFTAKAENILKGARAAADDVLDSNFADYNTANTDFKVTREVLDELESLFGKKVGVTDSRGGQVLRGIFSNNQSRSRLLQILPKLEEIATKYGVNTPDNLVDQAIFADLLEEVYGTQATTSLQGQVGRGVKGAVGTAQKILAGVRNPVEGAGELAATVAEKVGGLSPEKKRQVLRSLLGDLSEKPVRRSQSLPGFIGPKKTLTPASEDVIVEALMKLQKKGFRARADGSTVNMESSGQSDDLVNILKKRALTQDELKEAAELLKRQGVELPILFGKE